MEDFISKGHARSRQTGRWIASVVMALLMAIPLAAALPSNPAQGVVVGRWVGDSVLFENAPYSSPTATVWETNTSLLHTWARLDSDVPLSLVTPGIAFPATGLDLSGVNSYYQYTGVQSSLSFTPPFTLNTRVMGIVANGNPFELVVTTVDGLHSIQVDGNLNPANWGYYGTRASLNRQTSYLLDGSPSVNVWYGLTVDVAASGTTSVTLSRADGTTIGAASGLQLGTGPFYVLLGQKEGAPWTVGPNDATWQYVSVLPGLPVSPPFQVNPNLLVNPGFELGLVGWTMSQGSAIYSADTTNAHAGLSSAKGIETNPGSLGRLYQDVTKITAPGSTYEISGWINTSNVQGAAVIALDYVAPGGWTPSDGYVREVGYASGTTGWTYYDSGPFTLRPKPSDASAVWFLFDFNAGSGTAWWDDVSLTCVSGPCLPLAPSVPLFPQSTCAINTGNCAGGNCLVNTGDCSAKDSSRVGGDCLVNIGDCSTDNSNAAGSCSLNVGSCVGGSGSGGDCTVNIGNCDGMFGTGGTCTVNVGACYGVDGGGQGGNCVVNIGNCSGSLSGVGGSCVVNVGDCSTTGTGWYQGPTEGGACVVNLEARCGPGDTCIVDGYVVGCQPEGLAPP